MRQGHECAGQEAFTLSLGQLLKLNNKNILCGRKAASQTHMQKQLELQ